MRQSFNIHFYARACKCTKSGECPLELCINVNGARKFINLPYKTTPEAFRKKRQPKELSDYISLMRTRVDEILTDMLRNGEPLTTEALVGYLRNGGYRSYTVGDLFNEYLSITRERVGRNLTAGVYRKYELVRELFLEIVPADRECKAGLTPANIQRFKARVEGKYEQATAAGYLRKLKTMTTFAFDNGKIAINPFQGVKITKGLKPIIYLSKIEQRVLQTTPIENESLARVRDCAVFQMATGMAYADLKNFRKGDVKEYNGVSYIEKPRQKTGKVFTAVILPAGLEILKKYEGELPVITNQKYNDYLKAIQHLCGIETPLTTHVFRKTYASNLINEGVGIETVASALGDSTKIARRYYAKLEKETILQEISTKVG